MINIKSSKIKFIMILLIVISFIIFPYSWISFIGIGLLYIKHSIDDNIIKRRNVLIIFIVTAVCFIFNIFILFIPKIQKIQINVENTFISCNEQVKVDVDIYPDNIFKDDIKFISTNEDVANIRKIADEFYIQTLSEGRCVLKIVSNNSKVSDEIEISVIGQDSKKNISNGYVYVSANGEKFHKTKECSNIKDIYKLTIKEAKKQGYEPCKKCW